jgi:hypothetical protein
MKTCRFCKFSIWHKRSDGKPNYSKPGLCNLVTDKRIVVTASSGCGKWEKA